jgi:hypothetical protein
VKCRRFESLRQPGNEYPLKKHPFPNQGIPIEFTLHFNNKPTSQNGPTGTLNENFQSSL